MPSNRKPYRRWRTVRLAAMQFVTGEAFPDKTRVVVEGELSLGKLGDLAAWLEHVVSPRFLARGEIRVEVGIEV